MFKHLRVPAALIVALLVILSFVFMTHRSAYAAHPHFVANTATLNGSNLDVAFQEAGLGNTVKTDYSVTANATALYACTDAAGAVVTQQSVTAPVTQTGTSTANGQVTMTLTLKPPASPITCAADQTLVLAQIQYSNEQTTDATNAVNAAPVAGPIGACLQPALGICV